MFKTSLPVVTFFLGVSIGMAGTGVLSLSGSMASADQGVTGIGGVFFKADDPAQLRAWYRENLGMHGSDPAINFFWREAEHPAHFGYTVWAAFPRDTDYFGPTEQDFMINYRVTNLDALLSSLDLKGIRQVGDVEEYWYGRFAWILDGEGNRVELWEPAHLSQKELEKHLSQ